MRIDPVYDTGNVAWKADARVYSSDDLVDRLLVALVNYDDRINSES